MHERLEKAGVAVLMVYIQEAHTTLWPVGLNHPSPQKDIADRLARARLFQDEEKCPYPILVDGWANTFMHALRAWPDRYVWVEDSLTILKTSEYGRSGDMNGKVLEDCTQVLRIFLEETGEICKSPHTPKPQT